MKKQAREEVNEKGPERRSGKERTAESGFISLSLSKPLRSFWHTLSDEAPGQKDAESERVLMLDEEKS